MNLLEHLIVNIESTEDVTDAYIESMRKTEPYFTIEERVLMFQTICVQIVVTLMKLVKRVRFVDAKKLEG